MENDLGVSPIAGYSLPKDLKLLNSNDFSYVFDNAPFKASHPSVLILAKPSQTDKARVGLIVAKKNLKLAVQRNRFKRIVRESFRLKQHQIPAIDAIVLARRGIESMTNAEINSIMNGLWKRIIKKAAKGKSPA